MTTAIAPLSFAPSDDFDPFAGPALAAAVPSTAAQREVWAATWMGDDASLAFNEAIALEFRGLLDVRALGEAVRDVVARHEALRATFSSDGTVLAIAEPSDVPMTRHDWRTLPGDARDAAAQALRARVVTEPFDLLRGPLVRFDLARVGAEEHTLVISAHHIVCDGWSFGVVVPELAAAYSARRAGRGPDLPPADSFAAYASDATALEAHEAAAAAEHYWLAQFASGAPVLDLPTDRPRTATRVYASGRVDHTLGASLVHRVTRAGARVGASQFATLFGTFGILLQRLGAGEDLVIGVPAAGQPACGMPRLVGHVVSMLPVRLRITPDMPARDALAHARGQVLDAYEHQALSFGDLLARLPLARDPGRPPLVSVAFNVDRGLGAAALPFAGLDATLRSVPRAHENFDLFVNAVELDGVVTLECQYNRGLYDEATVRAWLAAYECLLDGVAAAGAPGSTADASVESLRLTPHGAPTVTIGPALALPERALVHGLIEAQVARTPDAIAIDDGMRALTYRALDARANQLAHHLRGCGVGPGALVGLCVERTTEMVVAALAVMKAGGAYVPLDPGHPVGRLTFMATDAAITLLLTEEAVRTNPRVAAAWSAVRVVSVDGADAPAIAEMPDVAPGTDVVGADDPAYVIYTSGSTGRPKGVIVPHRSVVNLLLSVQQTPGMSDRDVVLAITTLAFDIAVSEVLLPLTVGARVILASREVATDGLQLRALIERAGVTFIDATPATYRLLLAAGWEGGPHLRVICTGEAMPRDVGDALLARAGEVWNGYGPTETTVWSAFWRVTAPLTRVLIGRPVANTRAYVLDARQQPVPLGVRGELFIGGAGVTSGYLHRPELTAERFLADPFTDDPGARMYRTGDVARLLADGTLECLGRTDHQVKVRGYRIELGEIESELSACPGVSACAVVVREDRPDDRQLVAYVTALVSAPDASAPTTAVPDDAALRAHLAAVLPDYMIPPIFVRMAALPLTPSGKIDRAALPAPMQTQLLGGPGSAGAYVAPRTEAERLVAGLWAEALRVSRLGAHDDFFQLGGHSLMAAQVLGRLRRDHGIELPYRRIFEASTVERFADVVAHAIGASPASDTAATVGARLIPHDATRTSAPLTVLQHRIWQLEELDPATAATHVHSAAWRLVGAVDPGAVQGAIDDFVSRHDQMRTRFELVGSEPIQVVDPDARIVVTQVDVSALPIDERESAVSDYMAEQGAVLFALSAAPLMRVALIAIAPDEHLLFTVRHGMVWDGWSFDIFITEFCELLEARTLGRGPVLPALPITLGDFADWQQSHLTSPEMAQQVAWWRAHLGDDLPTLELPTDRPRPAQPTYRGDHVQLAFTRDEAERLTALAQSQGATLFMLFLSAYNVLLHRYTGQRDLLVGTPVRARLRPETEPVVGAFVNTVLLRFHVDPAAAFTDLLGRVRDVTLDAFGHQDMPFELLGAKVPALRALFSMQDARARPHAAAHVQVTQVHVPQRTATNDLTLWTMSTDDSLLSVLNFNTDVFVRATAERFLAQLRTLLLSLLDDAGRPIGRLPLLTADERRIALGGSTDGTAVAVRATPPSVLTGIIAAGMAHPDRAAVRDAAFGSVTYAELLLRAEGVRGALVAAGVGEGARVAVLSADLAGRVAAILGVHAVGGAVLLLDTHDPVVYNRRLVTDADIGALVASAVDVRALAISGPCVTLDTLAPATSPLVAPADARTPDAVAFLLHDVGASGESTTVPVSHATIDAIATDLIVYVGMDAATVAVPMHSPAAPSAIFETLVPLVAGGTLAAVSDAAEGDAVLLARELHDVGATFVAAPAEVWGELVNTAGGAGPRLTAVVTEDATPALLAVLAERVGRVFAVRGDAMTGGWTALSTDADRATGMAGGYDVGLGGARLFVLDADGEPTVPGVPGWLHVGPAAAQADDARAFRTGARARRTGDGRIEILTPEPGRLRRHGRVLGVEVIAAALRTHPAVADADVVILPNEHGDARPVACIVVATGRAYTESELRRHVRALLPDAAVPQRFVELDAIVRDVHGAPRWEQMPIVAPWAMSPPSVPPATLTERYVASLWQEMLGVSAVQSTDKFFDVGGHSLLCFRFIERVTRERGVRVSPRVVLLGTLEQVAAELDAAAATAGLRGSGEILVPSAPSAPAGMFGRIKRMLGGSA